MLSTSTATRQPDPASLAPLQALSGLCKASADPLRLQVLRVLCEDSFGVSELCELFAIRQPALSHHLKVLASAGLVATRREGNSIFYRRSELGQRAELEALQQHIFEAVDQLTLPTEISQRLIGLNRQREENSRSFFQRNAHKFQQQQDLIASYQQYAETVAQVLQDAPVKSSKLALEVGPGDGSFLYQLSTRFNQVVALDNAAEMLAQARATASRAELGNIQFIHGDTGTLRQQQLDVDCAVVNMVLHHTPDPGQILRDVADCLTPGGVLLVTDLCSHDQAWARETCGDLWLGFDPGDLTRWATAAGLTDIASTYLAQRNGFQIQVRLFGQP